MASTTQEEIIPIDTDPSYFVFANRSARMKQERTIAPGMTWKLYYGALPEKASPRSSEHDLISERVSRPRIPPLLDSEGEMVDFQDPWQGILEIVSKSSTKQKEIPLISQKYSDLDPTYLFYGL